MGDDPERLYRLDGVAHIVGVINDEPRRCISSVRRQQGMRLDERWFRLDEPLVSAFIERWRPETHTFHMLFGECTITLQDVAYQLGLPVDGHYVSGCLTDFHLYIEGGRPAWTWFHELLGVLPPENQVQKFAVNCTWFQETFGECPDGADEETLFADKSGNRIHIIWLPFVARLEEMGGYSWGSAALAWLYRCMCRVANRHVVKLAGPLQLLQSWIFWRFPSFRPTGYDAFSWPLASRWSGYNPGISSKGPRVQMARLKIDLLQPRDFIWMPYSALDVIQHQVDRVLPQFGGVQPPPRLALNIDFLMSKDGRGGHRWFPSHLAYWHLHWQERSVHILQFDIVADPGPSHDFLAWWHQHGKRFLSPEMYLGDPRGIPIPDEATQRGAGRVPEMDLVHDVPDRRHVERRARVGTRRSQREHAWLDHAMEEVEDAGRGRGRRHGRGGRRRGVDARDDVHQPGRDAAGGGEAVGVDRPHQGGMMVSGMDQTLQDSTPWASPNSMFPDFLASDGIVAEFGGPHFLEVHR
nr:protein MAIN-LIKE 2-like [Arachis hypogaea]